MIDILHFTVRDKT